MRGNSTRTGKCWMPKLLSRMLLLLKLPSSRAKSLQPEGSKPLSLVNSLFVNLVGLKLKRPGSIIEDIVADSAQVQNGLISYWGLIYIAKPQNSAAMAKLLGVYSRHAAPTLHFDSITLPETEDYRDNILAQKDSSPGPDGVPFSAYKAIPDTATAAIKNLTEAFASCPPPSPP